MPVTGGEKVIGAAFLLGGGCMGVALIWLGFKASAALGIFSIGMVLVAAAFFGIMLRERG